jgi:CopA family copper-resistance protein
MNRLAKGKKIMLKKVLTTICLLLFVNFAFAQSVIFTCPMHPEIIRNKPGDCPKCGMTLVKKKVKQKPVKPQAKPKQNPAPVKQKVKPQSKEKENIKEDAPVEETVDEREEPITSVPFIKKIQAGPRRTVRYDLYIADTTVYYTGKKKKAIAINGKIPAPTLYFNEGDTAEIHVHNLLKDETSIHWHGIILPNKEDGVPYLTTAPIKPGQTHLFKFPIVQNGTYWYHSHTGVQEQSGMYGAMILLKREEPDIKQEVIVLSDWSDMNPHQIDRRLHNQTDWFAIKKKSEQSYAEAIRVGHFKTKVINEWKRMLAMDVSDVAYDKFLINGYTKAVFPKYKSGDRVKLRIVNGSASTYFWLQYAGGKITVVANDGEDVVPVETDRLLIAVAETYDIIIDIPDDKSYEFLVTPEDRTRHSSIWLGSGPPVPLEKYGKLKYFEGMKMMNGMMKTNGEMKEMPGMIMTNQIMDMNMVMYPEINPEQDIMEMTDNTANEEVSDMPAHAGHNMSEMNTSAKTVAPATLNYGMLQSVKSTSLSSDAPIKTFNFELSGNMNRYVWTLDNKTVSETKDIMIRKGEIIRITMFNNTMMRHPMHLHGHFFRLYNGRGDSMPLKNVLDIMPMERDTIEFAATESGDWFFHCHILYHMMSGMGRIFSYENSPPNPDLPDRARARRKLYKDDRMFHSMINMGIESNGSDGEAMLANTRWKLSTMWHLGYHDRHGFESENMIGRYLGKMQWWYVYAGYDFHYKKPGGPENIFGNEDRNWFGQTSNKNNRSAGVIGIAYTLPMLFVADARIDTDAKLRFQLSREDIPIASRLRLRIMANTDKEYMTGFRYILNKWLSLSAHYDSDMGFGTGVNLNY